MIRSENPDGFKKLLTEYYTECANCETYPNVKSINEKWERYKCNNEGWCSANIDSVWTNVIYGIRRKPKTQIINGHEVVAPRYDKPTNSCDVVYWVFPLEQCGFRSCDFASLCISERDALMINGYYTSKEDASAFIKALRDNKND